MLWFILLNFLLNPLYAHEESCGGSKANSLYQTITSIIGSMEQSCNLKPNVPVVVTGKVGLTSRNYRLTKIDDENFVAEINLQFADDRGGKKPTGRDIRKTSDIYRQKVQECLDKYNPYLKGPNGEALTIKQTYDLSVVQRISVADRGARANSRAYPEDISCPTVIHEILHIMGLVDEYEEKQKGYIVDKTTGQALFVTKGAEIPRYDCRAIGPQDSIMNDHFAAADAVRPTYKFTICACPTKNKSLEEIRDCHSQNEEKNRRNEKLSACPSGMIREIFESQNRNKENTVLHIEDPKVIPPKRESLLEPAHFRLITNPDCIGINRNYLQCTTFSYLTAIELPEKKCDPQAEECKKSQDWLK